MNAEASGSRARPSQSRGHRPNRGRGGGRGGGHARGRGGGNNGGYHRGSSRGASHTNPLVPTMNDPSLDPQLAPRPPHPGYFHPSFLENPWYQLEAKLGIPHLKAIVPNQPQQEQRNPADHEPHELVSPQAATLSSQAHDDTT